MTPDAAGIVVQVDAALLIALVIDDRSSSKHAKNQNVISSKLPLLYLIGIYAVFISMAITLYSVIYHKELLGFAEQAAIDTLFTGFLPLILSAYVRIVPEIKSSRQIWSICISTAVLWSWFVIWWYSYKPHGLFFYASIQR